MPRKSVLILLAATIVAGCGQRDGDVTLTRFTNTGKDDVLRKVNVGSKHWWIIFREWLTAV